MKNYRYVYEPYDNGRGRHTCPQCHKPKKFKRFVDTETGAIVADHVGTCERVDSCGYHYTAYMYLRDNGLIISQYTEQKVYTPKMENPPSFVPSTIFEQTLRKYKHNNFVQFLANLLGPEKASEACNLYKVGTAKHYQNSTVFWQIDIFGNVRTGKIMSYDANTGKRQKYKGFSLINWVHSVLKLPKFNLKQCLFGEHLLRLFPQNKRVAIVESEKTAIIMSSVQDNYIWLACGSASNLNAKMLANLRQREIICFPDIGEAERKWKAQARNLQEEGFFIYVSDWCENKEGRDGWDIADFEINNLTQNHDKISSSKV
jgi:hypothetical protein